MKKNHLFFSMLIIVGFSFALISSEKRITINLTADMGKMFGFTKYHISFIEQIPDTNTNFFGESELEFPLDVFMPGINAGISARLSERLISSFNLNILKSIGNPNNTMKDSDWLTSPYPGGERIKFSYTESRAKITATIIDVEQNFKFLISQTFQASGILGYRYLNLSYDLLGLSGWQLDNTGHRVYFDAYQDVKVLYYMTSYYIPNIGIATEIGISPDINIDFKCKLSPYTLAKDIDDHILRNKTAEGNCSGYTFIANLGAVMKIPYPNPHINWYAKINFNLANINTTGYQTQTWYGDDPATDWDDTGTIVTGINSRITSSSQNLIFTIGRKF